MGQRLWQSRRPHSFLNLFNVVGHTPEFNRMVIHIRNSKTRARIAVSRLPYRTRIQQIAFVLLDLQRTMQFTIPRMKLQNFQLRILVGETALMVRVPVKGDLSRGIQEPCERL